MKTVTSEDLRWNLTQIARDAVAGKRVVVTFHGKPRFAIVPLADIEILSGKPAPRPKAKHRVK